MVNNEECVLCNNPDSEYILNEKDLCEECLEDIYRCKQCGIAQPYCSNCVL